MERLGGREWREREGGGVGVEIRIWPALTVDCFSYQQMPVKQFANPNSYCTKIRTVMDGYDRGAAKQFADPNSYCTNICTAMDGYERRNE